MGFGKGNNRIELYLKRKVGKNCYAGFVWSKRFPEIVDILVADSFLMEKGIRVGYITARKDGTDPCIIIQNWVFNGIKQGDHAVRVALFHELGHYCCGHLNNMRLLEDEFEERKKCVAEGQVLQEEKEADLFAAEYLGPTYVYWALQDSLDQRYALAICYDDPTREMAMREYQLRIDAINEAFGLMDYDDEDEEEE